MKITYISSSIIPSRTANSIHVMKMCQAFARNGHDVVLIAPDQKTGVEPNISDEFAFYGVKKSFEIIKIPMFPIRGKGHVYGYRAAKKAKKLSPDVVYCRNTPGCFFATCFKMRAIFESHSPVLDTGPLCGWMFQRVIKSSYLMKIVVITHALKRYYKTHYPEIKCEIQVAPDGADPVHEDIEPVELLSEKGRLKVGYVGHLYKGKGMEVISELAAGCNWADFHVVGGLDADIDFWKEETSTLSNIFFYGHVPHGETAGYIKSFDVVLLPNQKKVNSNIGNANIAQWTSPLKAFEYMAARKPIICSDLPVLQDIFEHERNALVAKNDINMWKYCLKLINNSNELKIRISNNAYIDFINNYTWDIRSWRVI